MAKKAKMPELIFVGAIGQGRNKMRFKHTVFRILDRHPDGTPKTCRLIGDTETVDIEGGEEFMTAYVPAIMFEAEKR